MTVCVAFNGLKSSGKDTAGEFLIRQHGFKRLSFAAPLKASAAAAFDIDPALWEELKNNPYAKVEIVERPHTIHASVSVREFLQRYGTEAHREIFGQGFWIDNVTRNLAQYGRVVITDARFENECSALKQRGAAIVRIERDSVVGTDLHASEAPIPEHLVDMTIENNGTLEELYAKLEVLARTLLHDPYRGRS